MKTDFQLSVEVCRNSIEAKFLDHQLVGKLLISDTITALLSKLTDNDRLQNLQIGNDSVVGISKFLYFPFSIVSSP